LACLAKAVPTYIELHGRNPEPLLYQEHMSDEASGPEDGRGESKDGWKLRMARVSGIDSPTAEMVVKLKFLEVIKPAWRSDEVRDET
jgi:hypothetical protein